MKTRSLLSLLASWALSNSSVWAAPALVWKSSSSSSEAVVTPLHNADEITPAELFADLPKENVEGSSSTYPPVVMFVLGRGAKGEETLSEWAAAGSLPQVASQAGQSHCQHHHQVTGMTTTPRLAQIASQNGYQVAEVSLTEYLDWPTLYQQSMSATASASINVEVSAQGKTAKSSTSSVPPIWSKTILKQRKRARELAQATLLIVHVEASTDPAKLDAAVAQALQDPRPHAAVVLTAVRSAHEVQRERALELKRRVSVQEATGKRVLQAREQKQKLPPSQRRRTNGRRNNNNSNRRRLEEDANQQQADNAQEDQQQDQDMSGVYFVHMTPNILAGILFFLLFFMITYIGIGCMGMISGPDVYPTKMPSIGREA